MTTQAFDFKARWERAVRLMKERGIDALFLMKPANLAYITGDGRPCALGLFTSSLDCVVSVPRTLSCLDVTRSLKTDPELEAIPIVAVTAFAMKGDEEQILAAGCDTYISKPISAADSIKAIRHYLSA